MEIKDLYSMHYSLTTKLQFHDLSVNLQDTYTTGLIFFSKLITRKHFLGFETPYALRKLQSNFHYLQI